MQDKKFLSITIGIATILILSWAFFISPTQQDIDKYKKQCRSLHGLTTQIHAKDYPPYDHVLAYVNNKQGTLENNIERISNKVTLQREPKPNKSLAAPLFRSDLEQKLRAIKDKTNQQGIKFDNKLGFSQTIDKVTDRHYAHLDIAYYAIDRLVDHNPSGLAIKSIDHLTLTKTAKDMINSYTLKINMDVDFRTLVQWLHSLSLPGQDVFFHIDKVTIENQIQNLVTVNVIISAIQIDLTKSENKKQNGESESTTPDRSWERY